MKRLVILQDEFNHGTAVGKFPVQFFPLQKHIAKHLPQKAEIR